MSQEKRLIYFTLLILLSSLRGYSQEKNYPGIRFMFYNTENFFDIYDDTLKADNDFLPTGVMRWNYTRYRRKINALYKTIVAAGRIDPPEIVAFCEVENRKILEDLVYGTYLSKFDYGIIHEDSPDQRGIDVCLIYRKTCISVIDYRYFIPNNINREDFFSRSVLYARLRIGNDTLHLFINHWPSRRGGVLAGEGLRSSISAELRNKIDSASRRSFDGAKIVIAGDFNCTPDDQEIISLITGTEKPYLLVNLSARLADDGMGSYRYMGRWEMIDQVLVSDCLLSGEEGLHTGRDMLSVFGPDFLLVKDPRYPGATPWSTYRGYRYQGGFSDHLPVILDIELR